MNVRVSYNEALELNYREWLPADRDDCILDVGCGDGCMLQYLSEIGYRNITGVDRDSVELAMIGDLDGVKIE